MPEIVDDPIVMLPFTDKFLTPDTSLLLSATITLLADTVPSVTAANLLISAVTAVTPFRMFSSFPSARISTSPNLRDPVVNFEVTFILPVTVAEPLANVTS